MKLGTIEAERNLLNLQNYYNIMKLRLENDGSI